MPKKKLSDIVLHRISPPDFKDEVTIDDLAKVMVRRIGLQRKKSRANHAQLLIELMKFRKENTPVTIQKISEILGVSISQTYEEIRKWRSLGLIEFTKVEMGFETMKGYMISAATVNRLIDHVESSLKSFLRETRRIAKDFDDNFMLSFARKEKTVNQEIHDELKQAKKELLDGKEEVSDVRSSESDVRDKDEEEKPSTLEEKPEKTSKKSIFKEFGKEQ